MSGPLRTSDCRSVTFSGRRLDLPFLTTQSQSPSASRRSTEADRTLQQVDPPPQISQPDGPGDTIEAGRNAAQRETQIEGDGQSMVGEDHPSEARQIHPRREPPTRRAKPALILQSYFVHYRSNAAGSLWAGHRTEPAPLGCPVRGASGYQRPLWWHVIRIRPGPSLGCRRRGSARRPPLDIDAAGSPIAIDILQLRVRIEHPVQSVDRQARSWNCT